MHLYIYQMLLSKVTYSAFRLYIYFISMCSLGVEPAAFCTANAMLSTEPQEHLLIVSCKQISEEIYD